MNYKEITEAYYSLWLTNTPDFFGNNTEKISWIYCEERNKIQLGYPCQYDIIIWLQKEHIVVSYGKKAEPQIERFRKGMRNIPSIEQLFSVLFRVYGKTPEHHIKFYYTEPPGQSISARALEKSDYPLYLSFFRRANPNCKSTDWLEDYYNDMVESSVCCGVLVNDILVSCTDTSAVPYWEDNVQEIGVNTLKEYRGMGYATQCSRLSIRHIIQNKKCPIWSCTAANTASIHLARKIGFEKLADFLTVTL